MQMQKVAKGGSLVNYQIKNNWRLQPHHKETPRGVSKTVPDDSYEIRDLISKYAAGLDPGITLLGEYSGEDKEVDFDDVDLNQAQRADFHEVEELKAKADELKKAAAERQQKLLEQMQEKEKRGSKKYERAGKKPDDLRNEAEEGKYPDREEKKGAPKDEQGEE